MSRTSPSQFEVMVEFMERNGDLNKFADGPQGRISAHNKWVELARVLNMDTTGSSKTVEKWKKVWSDLKNNTKRKAAKIHRSASGTGGGPACKLILTDLEQRVLNLTGSQAATGLTNITEVGMEPTSAECSTPQQQAPSPLLHSTHPLNKIHVEDTMEENPAKPGGSQQNFQFYVEEVEGSAASSTPHHTFVGSPRRYETGARRIMRQRRSTPRRHRPRPADAASIFLSSEESWRNVATEFLSEHIRLRERELEQQTQWQSLFAKFIEVLEKFNKST